MKKFLKKLSYALLVLFVIFGVMPLAVNAKSGINYDRKKTLYMSGKNETLGVATIFIEGVPNTQNISKSSVKIISGKNIVSLSDFSRYIENYSTEYFVKGKRAQKNVNRRYSISLTTKRTGIAKISFKIAGRTYTSTIKALPYVNPISNLTVTGVQNASDKNLAGKFKNDNSANIRVMKAQKNAIITCNAAKGWKITTLTFSNKKTNIAKRIFCEKGISSVNLRVGNLVAAQKGDITIDLINTKTGGTQTCNLDLE